MTLNNPSEQEIQQVMQHTGMQYLQALRHLQGRALLQQRPDPYPLGKSAYFE